MDVKPRALVQCGGTFSDDSKEFSFRHFEVAIGPSVDAVVLVFVDIVIERHEGFVYSDNSPSGFA